MIPSRLTVRLLALSILCTGFVIVVVNILIYRARIVFAVLHPEYVSEQPATISRALSAPQVGEPFAIWMAICAPILFVGVSALVYGAWREQARTGPTDRGIFWLSLIVVLLQAMASVGMVLLSHYRFPDHHEMHMVGSYLFFFSQAFVVVFGEFLSRRHGALEEGRSFMDKRGGNLRRVYIWVPVCLGVAYLFLFVIKGYDLGPISVPLYAAYTVTEPMLLSSFLGYVLSYHFDMGRAIWRYLRA